MNTNNINRLYIEILKKIKITKTNVNIHRIPYNKKLSYTLIKGNCPNIKI